MKLLGKIRGSSGEIDCSLLLFDELADPVVGSFDSGLGFTSIVIRSIISLLELPHSLNRTDFKWQSSFLVPNDMLLNRIPLLIVMDPKYIPVTQWISNQTNFHPTMNIHP